MCLAAQSLSESPFNVSRKWQVAFSCRFGTQMHKKVKLMRIFFLKYRFIVLYSPASNKEGSLNGSGKGDYKSKDLGEADT